MDELRRPEADFDRRDAPRERGFAARQAAWRSFEDLAVHELYAVLRLRCEVFVVEQGCAYADIDGHDGSARHLLVWAEPAGKLAGCLRVFGPGFDGPCARIGRVATAAAARGTGLGRWMMGEAFAEIQRRFGAVAIEIAAQAEAERFYAGLGFVRVSGDYREDGIAHCNMRRAAACA